MIYLNPPYQIIDGYSVLADHADPNLYYVLPPAPALHVNDDGAPAFSLLQYLGGGVGAQKIAGGLLTLTTALQIPDAIFPKLAARLARQPGSSGTPRLVPVLFDSGEVELIAFGATSAAGTPGGPFALQFLGTGKPSLGGANLATFQLVLDATAAELVERALDAPDLPLIAVYRLTFAGLRPSFHIAVEADWRKVYHSLQNKAAANIYFVAADAEVMINETLEENHIAIDTAIFGTTPEAQRAAERARKQLVDWVFEHLFTPIADPKAAMVNAIGQVIDDTIWSLTRAVLPGVSYKLRMVDDEQLRLLSARMDEAVAEPRTVIPQGTLGGLLQRFRLDEQGNVRPGWPALRNRLVSKVNLAGFPRLEVAVAVEDRFATDGLSSVAVELAHRDPTGVLSDNRVLTFRQATEREHYIVNLLNKPTDFAAPYQYRMTLQFNPTSAFGFHPPLDDVWRLGNTAELFIEPRWRYALHQVKVVAAPTFSFSQFPNVTLELRYQDEDDSLQRGQVQLQLGREEGVWQFRSFATKPRPYEYRITYHRPPQGGGDITSDWRSSLEDWFAVPDPLPTKRTLNLFFSLPWAEMNFGFIQLRYHDEHNGIHYEEQIDLNAGTPYLRRDYPIAADGPNTIGYRLTLFMQTGALMEGSWRDTEETRLVIDRRLVETRLMRAYSIGGTLAENDLREVHLQLQARDPATGQTRAEQRLTVLPGSEGQPLVWEYFIGDPPVMTIHYAGYFVDTDGFVTNLPWRATSSELLVIQLRTKVIMD